MWYYRFKVNCSTLNRLQHRSDVNKYNSIIWCVHQVILQNVDYSSSSLGKFYFFRKWIPKRNNGMWLYIYILRLPHCLCGVLEEVFRSFTGVKYWRCILLRSLICSFGFKINYTIFLSWKMQQNEEFTSTCVKIYINKHKCLVYSD